MEVSWVFISRQKHSFAKKPFSPLHISFRMPLVYLFIYPAEIKDIWVFKSKGEARIFGGSLDKCPQISGHKDTKEQKQLRLGVLHHQGSLLSYPGERGERHIDTSARHALNSSITALSFPCSLSPFRSLPLSPLSLSLFIETMIRLPTEASW